MPFETERKFLIDPRKLPASATDPSVRDIIESGYFTPKGVAVRIAVRNHGAKGYHPPAYKVGFKTPGGLTRYELEYPIEAKDALVLLENSPTYLKKERFHFEGWEIDCIQLTRTLAVGPSPKGVTVLKGYLWVAEYEECEGKPTFEQATAERRPEWLLEEVTFDRSYSNQALAWAHGKRV